MGLEPHFRTASNDNQRVRTCAAMEQLTRS